jgi:ribosomal protein L3
LDVFVEGEFVDVQVLSKGKRFSGVVKRHGLVVLVKQLTVNTTV